MMYAGSMNVVVIVAISILATIFVASLVGLIVVCKQRYCKPLDLISRQLSDAAPDAVLVESMEGGGPDEAHAGLELDHVGLSSLEDILPSPSDEDWVNDATGLAPHCLAILKTCHELTEKLVGMTLGRPPPPAASEAPLADLESVARGIGPRVDDVVRAMYPPLDPRLLEARCAALVLSVHHLVLVTQSACRLSGVMDWIQQSLADVHQHLKVLREASVNFDQTCKAAAAAAAAASESQSEPSHSQQNSPARSEEARV